MSFRCRFSVASNALLTSLLRMSYSPHYCLNCTRCAWNTTSKTGLQRVVWFHGEFSTLKFRQCSSCRTSYSWESSKIPVKYKKWPYDKTFRFGLPEMKFKRTKNSMWSMTMSKHFQFCLIDSTKRTRILYLI